MYASVLDEAVVYRREHRSRTTSTRQAHLLSPGRLGLRVAAESFGSMSPHLAMSVDLMLAKLSERRHVCVDFQLASLLLRAYVLVAAPFPQLLS